MAEEGGTRVASFPTIPLKKSIFYKKVCVIEQISRVTLAVLGIFQDFQRNLFTTYF
jgi:hypothetical protein